MTQNNASKTSGRTRRFGRRATALSAALLLSALLAACCGPGAAPPVGDLATPGAAMSEPMPSAAVTSLRLQLGELFDDKEFDNAYWGVRVERLNGDVLFDRNGDKEFMPASNMKIYTTSAALDLLGPDYTYKTRLVAVGRIADGALQGSLVIVGSGDPSLGSWHLPDGSDSRAVLGLWAEQVKAAGIREISGDVIGDGRYFTEEYYSPTWEYGDLPFWYATGSSGLAIEENCFRFTSAPAEKEGEPAAITLLPITKYITARNETTTTPPDSRTTLDIVKRLPESNVVHFGGTIALEHKPFQQRGSVWDGSRYAAFLLKETLEREGVRVAGQAVSARSAPETVALLDDDRSAPRTTLATYTSLPLGEMIAIVNKPSHNFFADQILRTLGKIKKDEGSFEAGASVVEEWLDGIGAPAPDTLKMYDGSGLARRSIVQPRQTCAVLRHMQNEERLRQPFYESLPIAGVDGTIRNRMTAPPTKGNVHAKTGFITRARALSGYVTDADGEMLVFSMMANQFTVPVSRANRLQDRACEILARFSERSPIPSGSGAGQSD